MTDDSPKAPRVLGSLDRSAGRGVVRMEERFDTDIDDLWSALTDPARLARWIGEFSGDFRVGGEYRARYYGSEWTGSGRIEACDPPRYLRVRSREDDDDEDGVTEATLTADGAQTVLLLEERGMPLGKLSGYGAGIQVEVEQLRAYVTGADEPDPAVLWPALLPAYEAMAAELGAR